MSSPESWWTSWISSQFLLPMSPRVPLTELAEARNSAPAWSLLDPQPWEEGWPCPPEASHEAEPRPQLLLPASVGPAHQM